MKSVLRAPVPAYCSASISALSAHAAWSVMDVRKKGSHVHKVPTVSEKIIKVLAVFNFIGGAHNRKVLCGGVQVWSARWKDVG